MSLITQLKPVLIAFILFWAYSYLIKGLLRHSPRLYFVARVSIILKFINAILISQYVYGGYYESGDTNFYDDMGREAYLAVCAHPFQFIQNYLIHMPVSTEHMYPLTGLLYWLMGGPSLAGAAVIAAFVSSIGCYLFWKSYHTLLSGQNECIYGYLIFLFPSLLFWTSIQLKEPWVFFSLAVATFSLSCLSRRRFLIGIILMPIGLYFLSHIKPHIFFFFICSIPFMVLWLKKGSFLVRFLYKFILLSFLSAVIIFSYTHVKYSLIGDKDFVEQMAFLKDEQDFGGSAIDIKPLLEPRDAVFLPYNVASVLFRPLPFEAHNVAALVSSLENIFFIILFSTAFIQSFFCKVQKTPYYYFCLAYSITFIIAYAFLISNLGAMVRFKIALFPYLFAVISVYWHRPRVSEVAVKA